MFAKWFVALKVIVEKLLLWLFNVTLAFIFLSGLMLAVVFIALNQFLTLLIKRKAPLLMRNSIFKLKIAFLAGMAAAFLMFFSISAKAGEDISHMEARKLQAAGEILSLEKIVEIARSAKSGDILETELERSRKTGLYIYEVEILDGKGMVWELNLNAKTGEIIKIEIDE
jgi:uncharacterized membrane protein YkoI